jgi:hypothetical protein
MVGRESPTEHDRVQIGAAVSEELGPMMLADRVTVPVLSFRTLDVFVCEVALSM